MQIRIPTKIARLLSQRILLIICVFLVLVLFLGSTVRSPSTRTADQAQPEVQFLHASGADIARMHTEKRDFLCVESHLYVIIDNRVFGLVDSFGEQIICKTI